jgi:hypothetical protein
MSDFDYRAILAERYAQEDRLREAGVLSDGGGVDLVTGQWDIFVYEDEDDETYAAVLHSVEEVDDYIAKHGAAAEGLA